MLTYASSFSERWDLPLFVLNMRELVSGPLPRRLVVTSSMFMDREGGMPILRIHFLTRVTVIAVSSHSPFIRVLFAGTDGALTLPIRRSFSIYGESTALTRSQVGNAYPRT